MALVERVHSAGETTSLAVYSECERYRYVLARQWDHAAPFLAYVMLNPSTATELRNDPTIERCERRARAGGFGRMVILNLFGFRATRPADLRMAPDPVGMGNDAALADWCAEADCVVAAWGVHGAFQGRATEIAAGLPETTHHLGLTKAGHPRHPLYVSYAVQPALWPRAERYPHL